MSNAASSLIGEFDVLGPLELPILGEKKPESAIGSELRSE